MDQTGVRVFCIVGGASVFCHKTRAGVGLFRGIGKRFIEIDFVQIKLDVAGGSVDLAYADVLINEIEENDL